MRILMVISLVAIFGCARKEEPSSFRTVLLEQLKNSYDNKNWYVSLKFATEGLSAEQANWKDSSENHSINELVSHLIFWNERNLLAFRGDSLPEYNNNNEETFVKNTSANWEQALSRLDSIQTELYQIIQSADATQLEAWSSDVANIASHNAYHTGQIIYIRKMRGWWEEGSGV
jgi:hypothetical protein